VKSNQHRLVYSLVLPALAIAFLWGVEWVESLSGSNLSALGILPRTFRGLVGVITAPMVHGGWSHLLANTTPLYILSAGVIYFYRPIAFRVVLLIYILSGFWVWVAARQVWHIGVSGVVYGLAFFLFFSGVFRKDIRALSLALIVALFYGGMFWGIFPIRDGMSWESHLFGAIAGILAAFHFRHKELPFPKKKYDWDRDDEFHELESFQPWNYKEMIPPPEGYSYPEETK